MIYADNAATTEMDLEAFEAMRPFLLGKYGNASQPYGLGVEAKKAIQNARGIIAECIGATPEEIYFTSGGTESDNWAIKCGCGNNGDIVTSVIEHHAVLNSCKTQERAGRVVRYISVSKTGEIAPDELSRNITDTTSLVSIMFANNEIGTIEPVKQLATIAHEHGCLFHTDAVQAVGHVDINVHDIGVDFLSASAHKFNGPKGIGFLYIKNGVSMTSFIDGGGQEFSLRAGTENTAAIVAMAIALRNNVHNLSANKKYLDDLETLLLQQLTSAGIDFIRNGGEDRIPGNISLSFANVEGEMILHRMDLKNICISTGSACDSVNTQVSHVIKAIGIPEKYAEGTVRISLGKNNTADEVQSIADALIGILV